MGIMNSEFVKFGVDVLNTFMEIVNKATSSLDGMWGSLSKIASVLAIF
jgi:antitoxin component HigA of HigAB toxin-antitoxin module